MQSRLINLLCALWLFFLLNGCAQAPRDENPKVQPPQSPVEKFGIGLKHLVNFEGYLTVDDVLRELQASSSEFARVASSSNAPNLIRLRRTDASTSLVKEIRLDIPAKGTLRQSVSIDVDESDCVDIKRLTAITGFEFEKWYSPLIFDMPGAWGNTYWLFTPNMASELFAGGKDCARSFSVSKRLIDKGAASAEVAQFNATLAKALEKLARQDRPVSRADVKREFNLNLNEFEDESQKRRDSHWPVDYQNKHPFGGIGIFYFRITSTSSSEPRQMIWITPFAKSQCVSLEDMARALGRPAVQSRQPPFDIPDGWRYTIKWEDDAVLNNLLADSRDCPMAFFLQKSFKHLPEGFSFDPASQ
jgi:hypothetical protein